MRPAWRPERRNRNMGTKASGHSNSNAMRIPESWKDKHGNWSLFYERLEQAQVTEATIGTSKMKFMYETPREGFTYGCSPNDVIRVLAAAESHLPAFPAIIAFRQPTHKQRQQAPVWGRFLVGADIGNQRGSAVLFEAQNLGGSLKWPRRTALSDRAEYERLRADGHHFSASRRHFEATLNETTVRNTILYRTLLHELGHWVQYFEDVLNPATALARDEEAAADRHFAKLVDEREVFAHAFAQTIGLKLRAAGAIPFPPEPWGQSDDTPKAPSGDIIVP